MLWNGLSLPLAAQHNTAYVAPRPEPTAPATARSLTAAVSVRSLACPIIRALSDIARRCSWG